MINQSEFLLVAGSGRRDERPGDVLAWHGVVEGDQKVIVFAADLLVSAAGFTRDPAGAAALAEMIEWVAGNRPGAVAAPAIGAGVLASKWGRTVEGPFDGVPSAVSADGVVPLQGVVPGLFLGRRVGSAPRSLAIHAPGLVPGYDVPVDTPMPEMPSAPLRLWEWLALIALGFLLVDAWLHTRGRIP